ncbi:MULTISPECIES: transglutaminase-like domain-containing protein [unclassified Alteromonas]|uniref:transglutaminase-like domain-containing protein n=1 Tax=unclassified Alteromonas TaxID=2614992 RepID=UPI00068F4820|nr:MULTISPECIES: transglutaminase-like domain-containing protein [unclassified Alteromonas]
MISSFFFLFGFSLLALNLFGLTQTLRPAGLTPEVLRFSSADLTLSREEFFSASIRLKSESDKAYAIRLTNVIADGMAHVHWEAYEPHQFNQIVPIWENYVLFLMGVVSGIPEFERYHFTIPEKSIERGIGLCGDASMLLSELLNENGIPNKIITIPGHVMVTANIDKVDFLLDPDFGVVIEQNIDSIVRQPHILEKAYNDKGYYNNGELMIRHQLLNSPYQQWNGAKHFVTKKYYFERISYVAIWLIPVLSLLLAFVIGRRNGGK